MKRPWALATIAVIATWATASAAPPAPARAPALQAISDCRKVEDPTQRLACYDKSVAAMVEAEDKGDLVSIDREQRRAVRRQAFGFSLPTLAIFDRGEKPEEINQVSDTVSSAGQSSSGHWVMRLAGGGVWRQIDDAQLSRDPRAGSKVVIKRALLGSYFMDVDGQPAIRVHRDD
jgi:hypothetical protein